MTKFTLTVCSALLLVGCVSSTYEYTPPQATDIKIINQNPSTIEVIPGSNVFLYPVIENERYSTDYYENIETGQIKRADNEPSARAFDLEKGSYIRHYEYATKNGTVIGHLAEGVVFKGSSSAIERFQQRLMELKDYVRVDEETIPYLVDLSFDFDSVDRRVTLKGDEFYMGDKQNPISLEIIVANRSTQPRIRLMYKGTDWIFANAVTIAVDDKRWKSPSLNFMTDVTGSSVTEWAYINLNEIPSDILNKIETADTVIIRFRGPTYYSDRIQGENEKLVLGRVLKLLEILNAD